MISATTNDDHHGILNSGFPGDTTTGTQNNTLQDEGVLRDVLDELDRERTRRAELELQIRKLTEEHEALRLSSQQSQRDTTARILEEPKRCAKPPKTQADQNEEALSRSYMAMETQVTEYQAILDELTKGKPAIAAAAASSRRTASKRHNTSNATTLPLHVIRLLEILPWTAHAHEHVFAREELYEWQFYDTREQKWISSLRASPPFFKHLPVVLPKNDKKVVDNNKERGFFLSLAAAGSGKNSPIAPSKQSVFTDEHMSYILILEDGYPLPNDGGVWEWIGGWRVEKRILFGHNNNPESHKSKFDCDEDGWSYSREAECFKSNSTEGLRDNPGEKHTEGKKTHFDRNLRRRKWTRQRVLVDYPYASEGTKEYLKLLAENARLTVATNKISDQLIEIKTALTEKEEILIREKSEASVEVQMLRAELSENYEIMRLAGLDIPTRRTTDSPTSSGNPIQDFLAKNEQMKGLSTKISQWVKNGRGVGDAHPPNSVSDPTDSRTPQSTPPFDETESQSPGPDSKKSNRLNLDWKKIGRGALLEKMKGHQRNLDQKKSSNLMKKFGEASQSQAAEGSLTDESVEDMDMQEAL